MIDGQPERKLTYGGRTSKEETARSCRGICRAAAYHRWFSRSIDPAVVTPGARLT